MKKTCKRCGGEGLIETTVGGSLIHSCCPECGGSGSFDDLVHVVSTKKENDTMKPSCGNCKWWGEYARRKDWELCREYLPEDSPWPWDVKTIICGIPRTCENCKHWEIGMRCNDQFAKCTPLETMIDGIAFVPRNFGCNRWGGK
jgi:hypothetical protein